MSRELHRLIYCSRNAIEGDASEAERHIEQILVSARRNNRAAGVSGALLFTQGCFVQALEGERDTLELVFERIQGDERHNDVAILVFEPIAERMFPNWDMAYLGDVGPGTPARIAAMTLADAFEGKAATADTILNLIRGVVDRETTWNAAPEDIDRATP
jgi:hypothetical protein